MAEDHVEFLKEYNAWIIQRRNLAKDTSPEAFLVDRAKDEALDRLIAIEEEIDAWDESGVEFETDTDFANAMCLVIDELRKIVKG